MRILHKEKIKASFFLTGRFYANPSFQHLVRKIRAEGHYMGAHSNDHLLYCDWIKRDSLLVSKKQFTTDLEKNYEKMRGLGLSPTNARFFLPPYEWYNDSIAAWTKDMGLQLVNYTPGTLSNADYTTPLDKNYRTSETIFRSIAAYEEKHRSGLNGFLLLMHFGTDPKRTDKFYAQLPELISFLKKKGYRFVKVDELLDKR